MKTNADRFWRSLIRIENVSEDKNNCVIVIPGWNAKKEITISTESMPEPIRNSIESGNRIHAEVNIGVYEENELKFKNWENS